MSYTDPLHVRNTIEVSQRTMGQTAGLLNALYHFQHYAIKESFPDAYDAHMLTPIIGLEPDDRKSVRGRYASVGPIGYSYWITLNPLAFETGADMAETLVHELAHWYCDLSGWEPGHGAVWQGLMAGLFGITTDDNGKHLSYGGTWHDLYATALALELDTFRLT